jgi:hypothetical protein
MKISIASGINCWISESAGYRLTRWKHLLYYWLLAYHDTASLGSENQLTFIADDDLIFTFVMLKLSPPQPSPIITPDVIILMHTNKKVRLQVALNQL